MLVMFTTDMAITTDTRIRTIRYMLENCNSIPSRGRTVSLHHSVQTDSEVHPDSYPMGSGGSLPRSKMARA
jgi:hypothetical protein